MRQRKRRLRDLGTAKLKASSLQAQYPITSCPYRKVAKMMTLTSDAYVTSATVSGQRTVGYKVRRQIGVDGWPMIEQQEPGGMV